MYNFDKCNSRIGSGSVKWDCCKEQFESDDVLPLWVADMDFETADEIKEAMINRVNHGIFGYTVPSDSFYESLINWYKNRDDALIKKDWIINYSTLVLALHVIIEAFVKKGEGVIIQTPVYHQFKNSILHNEVKVVESPLLLKGNKYKIDFDDFEKKIVEENVSLFILCNPHNPVGRVWTRDELERVATICRNHNVLVVSDEIHGDLIFKGYKYQSFLKFKNILSDKLIIINSLSKTFNIAGLQLGNVIVPDDKLRERLISLGNKKALAKSNIFGLVATEAGYRYGETWLNEVLEYIENNKKYCENFINENIKDLKVIDSEGTYLLWIDCTALNLNDNDLSEFMIKKARIGINNGCTFGDAGSGFIRLNIGCSIDILKDAMNRLKEAVNEL